MTRGEHLTEIERQGAADGTLSGEEARDVREHLEECASCAADVARLEAVVTRARASARASAPELGANDDVWPEIRSRIERSKVVRLDSSAEAVPRGARRPWLAIGSTAIAAALLIAAFAEMQLVRVRAAGRTTTAAESTAAPPAGGAASGATLASTVDSSRIYEAQAEVLLRELEMQRAMMRPSTSASLDGDLAIIDRSIAEQKEALARDPHNVSLQRLLAASYREKVELLERANNAG